MRKKRFKSILAMILAASMVMGSGVSAAGAELSTVAGAGKAVEETVSDSGTEGRTDAGAGNPAESVTDMASGNAGDTEDEDNNGGKKEALDNTDKNAPEQTSDESAESVSKDAASEDEVKTPAEEGISDNSASDDQVSDNGISDNGISVNDAELTEGSESEDAAGAAESLILYVSGNTVSYDGTYKTITVSSNLTGADYSFDYSIISADDTDEAHKYPCAYKDFSKGTSANITVNKSATTIRVNAVDAGRYAVSVNALSKNGTSLSIISNNVVFLSINK
ncbi:MAG: hypothetical protein IJ805_03920, partial [Lachnospiraceae bacterium]|nr:hypothetical protein [Lachnospiraceae bacterium]